MYFDMKKFTFQVQNVKCGGCANTLKKALHEAFGEVEVDLTNEPREITVQMDDTQVESLRKALKQLGYPMFDENLNGFETFTTTAKSFVSCAIGKMGSENLS